MRDRWHFYRVFPIQVGYVNGRCVVFPQCVSASVRDAVFACVFGVLCNRKDCFLLPVLLCTNVAGRVCRLRNWQKANPLQTLSFLLLLIIIRDTLTAIVSPFFNRFRLFRALCDVLSYFTPLCVWGALLKHLRGKRCCDSHGLLQCTFACRALTKNAPLGAYCRQGLES